MTVVDLPLKNAAKQNAVGLRIAEVVPLFRPAPVNAKLEAYALYLQGAKVDDNDITAGIALYERALELDPALALAHTNLGNCHYRLGRVSQARGCYEKALSVDPRQPEALYNLGYIAYNDDGDLTWAIFLLEAAVASDPAFADAWYNLGKAYRRRLGTHRSPKVRLCFARYLKLTGPVGDNADEARSYCAL